MSLTSGVKSAGGAVHGAMGGQGGQLGGGNGKTGLAGWFDNWYTIPLKGLGFVADVVTSLNPFTNKLNALVGSPSHYTNQLNNYLSGQSTAAEQIAAPVATQPTQTSSVQPGGLIGALQQADLLNKDPSQLAPGQTPYDAIPGPFGKLAQYGYKVRERDPVAFDQGLQQMTAQMNRTGMGQGGRGLDGWLGNMNKIAEDNRVLVNLLERLRSIYGDQIGVG